MQNMTSEMRRYQDEMVELRVQNIRQKMLLWALGMLAVISCILNVVQVSLAHQEARQAPEEPFRVEALGTPKKADKKPMRPMPVRNGKKPTGTLI